MLASNGLLVGFVMCNALEEYFTIKFLGFDRLGNHAPEHDLSPMKNGVKPLLVKEERMKIVDHSPILVF